MKQSRKINNIDLITSNDDNEDYLMMIISQHGKSSESSHRPNLIMPPPTSRFDDIDKLMEAIKISKLSINLGTYP